jgi:hypothetical protein
LRQHRTGSERHNQSGEKEGFGKRLHLESLC